ncbi:hypothetical protein C922_01215 [Plasmodium inui San Antonio 1]|uniref:subtilisin n=1 Tax=Plasmodium inui San Antonio 1 TaxID=1237626 RepID=W7A523_9APIC|nr:hypothetical protein C922_01215 [Plasmodium inui San Antonio 1]EUD68197.1 hypothetical protein C922_01215 [Plasmodium inui San Antonio 1]
MVFTKERHRHVAVATIFYHIIALLLFSGDATVHWYRRGSKGLQRTMNGRVLQEDEVGSLPNELRNYSKTNLSIPSFVQVKVKDKHDRKIRGGGATPERKYHIPNCDDTEGSSNFLKRFYRSMKDLVGITSHDRSSCLRYEKFRRFKQHFVHMVERNLSVGKTRVCLIDTGVDLQDGVVTDFLRIYRGEDSEGGDNRGELSGGDEHDEHGTHPPLEEDNHEGGSPSRAYPNSGATHYYGINTERCNEDNYATCQSSDVNDVDMHGTFIANTVIRRDLLIKRETYRRGVELIVCKAFGDTEKMKSHLMPLIKCLEHCKERDSKVIHVGYNVQGESEKLVEVMEQLERAEIVVVSPSLRVYGGKGEEPSTERMYPSSFADTFENVFSVGALRNSPQGGLVPISGDANPTGERQKGEPLHRRENTTLFSFSYGKTFPFGRSPSSMVEDGQGYASADFVNTLVMIFNLNPKLSVRRMRLILEKSIVRRGELKELSKWGGYIDLYKVIDATLKERNELCKTSSPELDLDLEEEAGNRSFMGGLLKGGFSRGGLTGDFVDWVETVPTGEEEPTSGEAITGEVTPRLDDTSEEGEEATTRLEDQVVFPPQSAEMEEMGSQLGGETLWREDSEEGNDLGYYDVVLPDVEDYNVEPGDLSYYQRDVISKGMEDFSDGVAALSEDPPSDTTYSSSYNAEEDVYLPDEAKKSFHGDTERVTVARAARVSSLPLGMSFLENHTSDEGSVPPLNRRREQRKRYGSGEETFPPLNGRSLSESESPERWDQWGTHAMDDEDSDDSLHDQAHRITQMNGTRYVDGLAYDAEKMYGNSPDGMPARELGGTAAGRHPHGEVKAKGMLFIRSVMPSGGRSIIAEGEIAKEGLYEGYSEGSVHETN